MRKIILASSSPRRKELLKSLGIAFTVMPSNIEETLNPRLGPASQAEQLSQKKANVTLENYKGKDIVVIAADSIVVLGPEQLGKPETIEDAKRMLTKLSGKKHSTVTGFTIVDCLSGKSVTKSVETRLWVRKLTSYEINSYIKKEHVFDKAGSYAVCGLGALLFERIDGDYFNVLGLPLVSLYKELKKFGISLI